MALASLQPHADFDEIRVHLQGYGCAAATNSITLSDLGLVSETAAAATCARPAPDAQPRSALERISNLLNPAPGPTPTLQIADVTGTPGQTLRVEVDADAVAQGIEGARLVIAFGSIGTADVSGVAAGPLIQGPIPSVLGMTSAPGQLTIGAIGGQPANGPGAAASFPLRSLPTPRPGHIR